MVIKMFKKIMFTLVFSISLGALFGIFLHNKLEESVFAFNEGDKLIFLREGVYTDKKVLEENTKKLDPKLIVYDDDKYYVYVGITTNEKVAKKIKSIYDDMDIEVYEKDVYISDDTFINNVEQFDSIILSSKGDDILTVEEVVLSNYEEVFGNGA